MNIDVDKCISIIFRFFFFTKEGGVPKWLCGGFNTAPPSQSSRVKPRYIIG